MVATQDRAVSAWRKQVQANVKVAGNGPPVVFFHGAFGLQWDAFLDGLAQTHTVYAPEHPGTTPGAPDSIKPIDTLWDLVLYYYELLDELGLDAPAVVGHSFGGMVAAEVAATNPARVSKLVLIDPVGLWRDDTPVTNWMMTAQDKLATLLYADTNNPIAQMMSAAAKASPEQRQAMMDLQIQMMWSLACTGKFVWPIPDKGLKKRIHRISAPTLVIAGRHDWICPPEFSEEIARLISRAELRVFENSSHSVRADEPQALLDAIAGFVVYKR